MEQLSTALSICLETVRKLGRNWSTVLRICALPLFLPLMILFGAGAMFPEASLEQDFAADLPGTQDEILGAVAFLVVVLLTLLLGSFYVAIAWHRFDILDEPQTSGHVRGRFGMAMGYLWRSLLLGLIWVVLSLAALIPLLIAMQRDVDGSFFVPFGALPWPASPGNVLVSGIAVALTFAAVLRWSLILPAIALGRVMTLRESQDLAAKLPFIAYFWIGLIVHFSGILLELALWDLEATAYGALVVAPFLLLFWTMFGIALITTLYLRLQNSPPPSEPAPAG